MHVGMPLRHGRAPMCLSAGDRDLLREIAERVPRRSGMDMARVATPEGLEPPTSGVEIRGSIQLSYGVLGHSYAAAHHIVHNSALNRRCADRP